MAKMLLIRGAQPNLADKNDSTPLHVATIFGHAELVKLLLRYDADVYRKGQHGAIPIHIAASEGHVSLLRVFADRGVNVNVKVCRTYASLVLKFVLKAMPHLSLE